MSQVWVFLIWWLCPFTVSSIVWLMLYRNIQTKEQDWNHFFSRNSAPQNPTKQIFKGAVIISYLLKSLTPSKKMQKSISGKLPFLKLTPLVWIT